MFKALHELAKNATLMIVVTGEAEQLRVNVTPMQAGDKTKPHALRPLSLLGTPDELDADFAAALAIWQAPKRSLIEQAQAAAELDPDADDDPEKDEKKKPAAPAKSGKSAPPKKAAPAQKPAAKSAAKTSTKPPTDTNWPFPRKPAPAGEEPTAPPGASDDAAATEPAEAASPAAGPTEDPAPDAPDAVAPTAPAVDFTLDLF